MKNRAGTISTALLAFVMLHATAAQAQQWNVEAQAGRIRSALDPAAAATESVVLGVRFDDTRSGLRLSAGVPTSSDAPLWAALGAATRLAARSNSLLLGVDVSGQGFLLEDRAERTRELPGLLPLLGRPRIVRLPGQSGHALAGQLLPVFGFEGSRVQAYARAGVSTYSSSFGDQDHTRTVPLADLQVTVTPTSIFAITPSLRRYHTDEGRFTYAGLSAALAPGRFGVWGSAGQWFGRELKETAWAAGASLRVQERTTLLLSTRRDAIDPLYGSAPQTSWHAGLSIGLGALSSARAPVPAQYENGRATIQLSVSHARGPASIAGDFNGWKPQPMQRTGDHWTFTVPLARGVYNYAFVNEQGEWFVPEKHPGRKDDGMGGYVAVLVVP